MEVGIAIIFPGFRIAKGDEEGDVDICLCHRFRVKLNFRLNTFELINMVTNLGLRTFAERAELGIELSGFEF